METYDLRQKVINTKAINVSLRSFNHYVSSVS